MVIVESYVLAVFLCLVTMMCWGSWANTQKLATREWKFQLFYWDYAIGVFVLALLLAFTLGSWGQQGQSFMANLAQANARSILMALLGGTIFNLSNILLVAAIAVAGMAVAFPVGVGLALVIGVITNYIATPVGNSSLLFAGVGCVVLAIVLDAMAYKKLSSQSSKTPAKGIILSVVAGLLMGFFYRFVASSMSPDFVTVEQGMLTPYAAIFVFSAGLLASNVIWNTIVMYKPFTGERATYREYLTAGSLGIHAVGVLGGVIWCLGMSLSIIASGSAGFAISYGLGQGATMVAAFWGVFIWKEFKAAPTGTNRLLALMFAFYIVGLALIILSRVVGVSDEQGQVTAAREVAMVEQRIPVILDTDIGDDIDDTWALAFLLQSPEFDVKLVVSATGDTSLRSQFIAKTLEQLGRTDIPIGVGKKTPDEFAPPLGPGRGHPYHQRSWLDDYDMSAYQGTVHPDGVGAMIDTIMSASEPINVITIGPLPNLAEALRREPAIASRSRLVGMLGSVRIGYGGSDKVAPEWNVRTYVPDAQAVFNSNWPMMITPLDTCGIVRLTSDKYQRILESQTPAAQAVISAYRSWVARPGHPDTDYDVEQVSSTLFDTVAVYLAMSQELVEMETLGLRVDDQGYTIIDPDAKPIDCAMQWKDLEAFENLIVERLTAAPPIKKD